jgi:hypothetical protein
VAGGGVRQEKGHPEKNLRYDIVRESGISRFPVVAQFEFAGGFAARIHAKARSMQSAQR